jgi:SAM-dependent methyltransferase
VKLSHFEAFAPRCPVCLRAGRAPGALALAHIGDRTGGEVIAGTLQCPDCQHEYPVLEGIPVIVADLPGLLGERGVELMVRDDIDPVLESLFGDAIGPDSWFDAVRQMQSTYGWDAYADLDPDEAPHGDGPAPGAARRCLRRLLQLSGPAETEVSRVLDLGCAAGRTSFVLAEAHRSALVLGLDVNLGLLRLARRAGAGHVSYPRRRIGLVYDRRRFGVDLAGAARVDFWACDAISLPLQDGQADLCAALNLIDCVANPRTLLESLARVTRPGGRIVLSTPYDWAVRATPLAAWLGGHSQRAPHAGAGEAFLRALAGGVPGHSVAGTTIVAEHENFAWQTRLHDRSSVNYRTHLLVMRRDSAGIDHGPSLAEP